jgi:hypothetical protein
MKSPSRPFLSRKFLSALAALSLATPVIFAAGGMPGGGGGRGGGGAQGGNRGGATPKAPNPVTELTNKYDKNKNGRLDTDELKALKKENDTLFQELIKLDANKNNVLDVDELAKWGESKKTTQGGAGGRGGATGGGGGGGRGGS